MFVPGGELTKVGHGYSPAPFVVPPPPRDPRVSAPRIPQDTAAFLDLPFILPLSLLRLRPFTPFEDPSWMQMKRSLLDHGDLPSASIKTLLSHPVS